MRNLVLAVVLSVVAACSAHGTQQPAPAVNSSGASGGQAGTGVDTTGAVAGTGGTLDIDAMPDGPKAPLGDKAITAGTVPDGVADLFTAAGPGAGAGPALVYPTPGTMLPPNIARVLFQWTAAQGSVFQLHFDTPTGKFDVYTDGQHDTCKAANPDGKCWESDAKSLLPYLTDSAGKTVTLTLRALDATGKGLVWESAPYKLFIGPAAVTGAIYYWSTTVQGIRRGTLDGRDPADYFVQPLTENKCVACHTLSRSGKHMSVALPGDLLGVTDVVETVPPPVTFGPPPYMGTQVAASWATFSPDDKKLVVAGQGVLSVVNAADAKPVGGGAITLPDGTYGSMPDWAPDGKHLVFASITSGEKARHLKSSSIAMMSADGDSFSGFEFVAESKEKTCGDITQTYANPMFSPDSKYVAFSRANCESEGDPTAKIVLAPAVPNAEQIELTAANTAVGDKQLENLQNGMPTWAPTADSTIAWIAFTSTRDYGFVLGANAAGSPNDAKRQLWVAAVDLSKVGQGDPSYPAFRLPAQDLTENNHRPFWAVDVLPPDWRPPVK